MSKLSLDRDKIDLCRKVADQIVNRILRNVERHTTPSIERSVLRLLGVEGALEEKPKEANPEGSYPLVNALAEKIGPEGLAKGAGYWFGLASLHHPRLTPVTLARKIVAGEIDLQNLERAPIEKIHQVNREHLGKSIQKLRTAGEKRKKRPAWRTMSQPLKYVIVATGNIHEDVWQAQAAAEMGADIIAVIRSTAQSLLDYVPEGETTEGYGGTFATQANFRLMRQALDQTEKKLKRRIGLTNYSSGLCMPEIAVIGALEGIDYLLNDAMYGILFRDINMKRNFVDQHFSRRICSLSEITIQTGEDNYLTTAESHKYWHQVLASHFINHAFAKKAGLPESSIALGHAHEIDPWIEDSLLMEWGQAQLVREVFPRCPIKFMPPTKHKTGDIFFSYLYDGLFNLAGILTGQNIQLLGMHTEAIHNPYVQDRYLSLKNANYIFQAAKSIAEEVTFQANGKVMRRARQVLEDAGRHLKKISLRGLMPSIAEGAFANVRREIEGGKGAGSVIEKDREYYTQLHDYLTPRQEKVVEERFPRIRPSRMARNEGRGRDRDQERGERNEGRGQGRGRNDSRGRGDGRDERGDRRRDRGRGGERGRGRRPEQGQAPRQAPPPREAQVPMPKNEIEGSETEISQHAAATVEVMASVIYLPPPGTDLTSLPPMPETGAAPGNQRSEGEEGKGLPRRRRSRGRRGRGRRGPPPPQGQGPGPGQNQGPMRRRELKPSSSENPGPQGNPNSGSSEQNSPPRSEAPRQDYPKNSSESEGSSGSSN